MDALVPAPCDPAELARFLDSFLYRREAFLIDRILRMDAEAGEIDAELDTTRPLPFAAAQRVGPGHPAHVSAPEILMATGSLGCLHAWFFHGCHWDRGWVAFGSRIHRADYRRIARIGPTLALHSRETRTRVGPRRVVLRYAFDFRQEGESVYTGDQTAMFLLEPEL